MHRATTDAEFLSHGIEEMKMPQRIVRRAKNWKFSHAAAAMGAFWARARQREARRMAELRSALVENHKAGASLLGVAGTVTLR